MKMIGPLTMLVAGEMVLVLLLVVLVVFLTKRPRNRSPKTVREDVKKIKEQVMMEN